jgi:uncharacterized protein (DUF433 family)
VVSVGDCELDKTGFNYDMNTKSVIVIDPEIMSGTPVFAGTRVPIQTLIDHIRAGDGLDVFLEDFPSVTREQALAFLDEASEKAVESVRRAA